MELEQPATDTLTSFAASRNDPHNITAVQKVHRLMRAVWSVIVSYILSTGACERWLEFAPRAAFKEDTVFETDKVMLSVKDH